MDNERSLTLEVEDCHPIGVLHLGGFLGQLEVYKLKMRIESLFDESKRFLIFDLKDVNFIDSAGIGVVSQMRAECIKRGGQLAVVKSQSPQVAQSLQYSGLQKLIDFFDDGKQALNNLRIKHGLVADELAADAVTLQALAKQMAKFDERLKEIETRLSAIEGR